MLRKLSCLFLLIGCLLFCQLTSSAQSFNLKNKFIAPTPLLWTEGLLVHSSGDIYIGCQDRIDRFDSAGTYKGTFATQGSEPGQVFLIHDMNELPNGNLLVGEYGNNRLSEWTPNGQYVRAIRLNDRPYGTQGVAVLPDGRMAAVDHYNNLVYIYNPDGSVNTTFPTPPNCCGLEVDADGYFYLSVRWAGYLVKCDISGNIVCTFGNSGIQGQTVGATNGLRLIDATTLAVTDDQYDCIWLFGTDGSFKGKVSPSVSDGIWQNPRAVDVDSNGDFIVCDSKWDTSLNDQYPLPALVARYTTRSLPPASSFTATPSNTWSYSDVSATITAADNSATGIKEIHYSINMGAEQIVASSITSFTLTETGTHNISYFAVDNAGNTETTQYAIVKVDKIAPVTTLSQNGGLIALSASDAHSGVSKIKYQVNGGPVADYSVPFADTVHKVTYWAEDAAGNVETAKTDIINAGVQAISVSQPRLNGGTGVVGTVTLDKAAGVGGTVINLASSLPGVAVVEATVTVPEGATTATFDIDANPVAIDTSVSITASIYETSQSALVTVQAPMPSSLTWSVSPVVGGTSTTGTLTLTSPAPTGGTTVSLASSSLSAIVGSSVTIPAGSMTASFTVSTNAVSNDTSAVISATVYGVKLKSTLSILGPKVTSVTLASASVVSLGTTTGTVTLSTNAPVGGKVVTLSSSNASVASVPVSVTVAAGTRTATFTITAGTVIANTNATITATTNGSTGTATITVTPPAAVLSTLTTNVAAVTGGVAVTGTVTLTSAAPTGGAVVTLSSSSTTIGTVPASVTVAAGSTTATFTITTRTVTAASSLTITATRNGVSKTATITVNPVRVVSTLTLNPTSVVGGSNSTGTVTLTGIATEAVVVTLTSGTTSVARVPVSVTVPAGSTTATFTITTLTQTATRTSIITARTGTTSRTATLSVTR